MSSTAAAAASGTPGSEERDRRGVLGHRPRTDQPEAVVVDRATVPAEQHTEGIAVASSCICQSCRSVGNSEIVTPFSSPGDGSVLRRVL
jgi:hypothetical protein